MASPELGLWVVRIDRSKELDNISRFHVCFAEDQGNRLPRERVGDDPLLHS